MARLDTIVRRFQQADRDTRLETLLDYSRKLPPLPDRFAQAREAGLNRVHECQTPVFLWVEAGERPDAIVEIHADVPRESPTVRGFVALLIHALQGMTRAEVAALPRLVPAVQVTAPGWGWQSSGKSWKRIMVKLASAVRWGMGRHLSSIYRLRPSSARLISERTH